MKIHNVFHIDLLTPYKETEAYGKAYSRPSDIIEREEEYEVEETLDDRYEGRKHKQQFLIKWKGYPASENSWVNKEDLHASELLQEYL